MAKTTRKTLVGMAVLAALVGTAPQAAAGPQDDTSIDARGIGRVRTSSPAIAAAIQEATRRSPTFRSLIDRIDGSDGIVYVEEGACVRGVRACLREVIAARGNRIIRIHVDPHRPDWQLMGAIGHELRHAVEVLDNPFVIDTKGMVLFYQQIGRKSAVNAAETEAAIQAGDNVRREVQR